jgi:hypothetical protein
MARGYGEPRGGEYGSDENRDRWRDDERERSSWRSGGQGTSEREDERGFFERAGDEVRSWFSDDDDNRFAGRDYEPRSSGSPYWDRENHNRSGSQSGGWSGGSMSRDLDRERVGRSSSNQMGQNPGGPSGGRGQSSSGERSRRQGYGPAPAGGQWSQRGQAREPEHYGLGRQERGFGGFRDESDFRGRHRGRQQSWGETDRDENESLGYGDFSGTLGGFGNQTFGSSQDDHYRSWRDRQMRQLDNDYSDYCREREKQFHSDFDSWRRNRQGPGQSQSQSRSQDVSQSSEDELILGGSSTSGVSSPGAGTVTSSPGGSPAVGGGSLSSGSSKQSDTGAETTGAGSGVSGRSRNRS